MVTLLKLVIYSPHQLTTGTITWYHGWFSYALSTSTSNEPKPSKTWWHDDTTRFIPRDYFRGLVPLINSIRCHQPVPRRRVSIRPKPPTFQESKLPVWCNQWWQHAVWLWQVELQKIDCQDRQWKFQIDSCTTYFCIKNFLKLNLRWTSAVFKQFPSHDFGSTEHRATAVSSQLTRWKRRSKAASFSMCLVYLERFPVLVCRGNDGPTVPPTNKMADALYAYKIRLKWIYNHFKTSNQSVFDQTLMWDKCISGVLTCVGTRLRSWHQWPAGHQRIA